VYREGRSHASRHLVLYAFPRSEDSRSAEPRLGVSVGRKVGGAVERNRVKRLLREAFWALGPTLPDGHDFVVVARPDAGDLARSDGEAGIERALQELLEKAGFASTGGAPAPAARAAPATSARAAKAATPVSPEAAE
jgi:ribonuclease P protein component